MAQVAGSIRTLPKPTSRQDDYYASRQQKDQGRKARVMIAQAQEDTDQGGSQQGYKPRFPQPSNWDHSGWKNNCLFAPDCTEMHAPTACKVFKEYSPAKRVAVIKNRGLCPLCFRHLAYASCWSKGKVPNCNIDGCGQEHHPLLHQGKEHDRAMIVTASDEDYPHIKTLFCCQDVAYRWV